MAKQTQALQQEHWVDQVVTAILEWQQKNKIKKLHVDDMKTPSGRVHVGSLRGVVLHDVVAKVLAEKTDQAVISTYVFNDMDSMDKIPSYLDPDKYQDYLGKPLHHIPAPKLEESGIDFSQASAAEKKLYKDKDSYAAFYAQDFIDAFRRIGCSQEIVWSHQEYESGRMDEVILETLNELPLIRTIYEKVADYDLPEDWVPFKAFDPEENVATTRVTAWDGKEVTVEYTTRDGLTKTTKIAPTGGTGKLLWKLDWPAHWKSLGITIEGAGKDHTSDGGSRDMANAFCDQLYHIQQPFDIPYEWILVRGSKMSSSKGVGTSAREFVESFPPSIARFLFINKQYNQVIDFDPETMAIPDLYDSYDQGARIFWGEETGDTRMARSFELSQVEALPTEHFIPRFRDVAKWMQHPEIDLESKFEEIKGSALTTVEKNTLLERSEYARTWIDRYAPDEYQLTPRQNLPTKAAELSPEQHQFVTTIFREVIEKDWDPQDLQQHIFDQAKNSIGPRQAFQAIYLALIGKTSGPRAGWLLQNTDTALLNSRLDQLNTLRTDSNPTEVTNQTSLPDLKQSSLLSISKEAARTYPTITLGLAVITGVTISKSHPELEAEKARLMDELAGITTKTISSYPEIESYRKMYRDMNVNWHSRRPSPEALLRRVAQGKGLYNVNTCVDAYNLAVMRHRVSVGAFDLSNIEFPTQLKIADGTEQILLLGETEPTHLEAGEVSYFDQIGPYNLDFNYRDAQRTAVTQTTTDLLINVDGVYSISRSQVEETLNEVVQLIQRYCGGELETIGIVAA